MNASRTATLLETLQPSKVQHPPHHLEPADRTLDFRLTLQSTSALLTVLANVGRLGCEIRRVHVVDGHAQLRVHPPRQVTSRRVAMCLVQVVGVVSISELGV